MTHNELQAAQDLLYEQTGGADNFKNWTDEQKLQDEEYNCISMMNSLFAYHGTTDITDESSYFFGKYLAEYITTLGRERFDRVRNMQLEEYKHCKVVTNVYTDCEGCTYNSITWRDSI